MLDATELLDPALLDVTELAEIDALEVLEATEPPAPLPPEPPPCGELQATALTDQAAARRSSARPTPSKTRGFKRRRFEAGLNVVPP